MAGTGPIDAASTMLAAARKVQSNQIRTISENIANANSMSSVPGGNPYSRKIAFFSPLLPESKEDPVGRILKDQSAFQSRYDPGNVAANTQGYVSLPNVNTSIESTNLQAAIRSYELNLSATSTLNSVSKSTLDLLE